MQAQRFQAYEFGVRYARSATYEEEYLMWWKYISLKEFTEYKSEIVDNAFTQGKIDRKTK